MTASAYVGLGGNVGNVRAAFRAALETLDATPGVRVEAVSRLYSTPPWGLAEQPDFLNAAARLATELDPYDLLQLCQAAERGLKRERKVRWGPRTIDLDILVMEGVEIATERLTIPHARLEERVFALAPLADLEPGLKVRGRSVVEWLAELHATGVKPVAGPAEWWRETPGDEVPAGGR